MAELFATLPTNATSDDNTDFDPGDPGVNRGVDFHVGLHNNTNTALNAVKAVLGTDAIKGGSLTLEARLTAMETATALVASNLAAHLADTTDAHDASAISITAIGGIVGTQVQAALAELDTNIDLLVFQGPPVDGGVPGSVYGGIEAIDGGTP